MEGAAAKVERSRPVPQRPRPGKSAHV